MRVLTAIRQLELTGIEVEYIIVDNNSTKPVEELGYVREFLQSVPWARVVLEEKPGLTPARIKGVNEAVFDAVLFVDDDVALHADYLQAVSKIADQFPKVGAWNAGIIQVKFLAEPGKWFREKGKFYFQESTLTETITGNSKTPAGYTPFGTGLYIRKEVFSVYQDKIRNGVYSMSDRVGNSTSSCGDSQIVLCALDCNFSIGRTPALKLEHLVSEKKSTLSYLKRLSYGIHYSFQFLKKESIPEIYSPNLSTGRTIKAIIYNLYTSVGKLDFRAFYLKSVSVLGAHVADLDINNRKRSWLVRFLLKLFSIR